MEPLYKLKQGVLCCPSRFGTIADREKEYPATQWAEDEAERYVKEGFLVRVREKEKEKQKN